MFCSFEMILPPDVSQSEISTDWLFPLGSLS